MEYSSHKAAGALSKNLFYLLLLVTSNLFTFFLITAPPSTSPPPCSLDQSRTTTTSTTTTLSDTSSTNGGGAANLSPELIAYTSSHPLPFGFNTNFDADTMTAPIGSLCTRYPDDLNRFMTYPVNGSCPDDELQTQKLLLRGCEPLPRRRCRPASPPDYVEPYPLPTSYWSTPSDNSIVWTAYTCKSYTCLINRMRDQKGFDDCKDCFDLSGREKLRWRHNVPSNGVDLSMDDVLATKKPGSIRIGLDIGGGTGTFAVRMKEKNVTIITTSMNLNGPFNNFIAARGVIPMYISISQRLPFFDNTLDIVHSMHVLSNWIPTTHLHFLMFDVYRVLRPGGLFWLDHFFCVEEQLETYVPLIESIGFRKVKWVLGRKSDRGLELKEMYITALLEKPLQNSW